MTDPWDWYYFYICLPILIYHRNQAFYLPAPAPSHFSWCLNPAVAEKWHPPTQTIHVAPPRPEAGGSRSVTRKPMGIQLQLPSAAKSHSVHQLQKVGQVHRPLLVEDHEGYPWWIHGWVGGYIYLHLNGWFFVVSGFLGTYVIHGSVMPAQIIGWLFFELLCNITSTK